MTEEPVGRLAPPVDPYDPPLVEVDPDPLPTPTRIEPPVARHRPLIALVVALAAVLAIGAVVLLVQLWPSATPPSSAASAAPTASGAPAASGTLPELNALPATLNSSLRSTEDGADTEITFVNDRAEAVVLSWIDEKGEQSPYATVEPGQTYVQKTYANHFWSVAGPDGTVIAVFQAADQPARALLR